VRRAADHRKTEQAWDLRHWTEMPKGGHFPALEVPDLLIPDVHRFIRGLR